MVWNLGWPVMGSPRGDCGGNRVRVFAGVLLAGTLLFLAGCVQELERGVTSTPTSLPAGPTPTLALAATPPPTAELPPTPTPVSELFLHVRGPEDGSTLLTNAVVVHGVTTPGATVTINGNVAAVDDDGRFQAEVVLSPGINQIEVVATGAMGNRQSTTLTVTSIALPPQPFFLLITEPKDQSVVSNSPIRLSGRTSADAVVSINGVYVPVDVLGIFSTTVRLESGPNIIEVVATNTDGRVLNSMIALIFRP